MDNASKAIVFAGGFLVAMLLISIFMYSFSNIGDFLTASNKERDNYAIDEFNKFFTESYYSANGGMMYGYDAYNIMKKVDDINNDIDAPVMISVPNIVIGKNQFLNVYHYEYHISDTTGYVDEIRIY